MVPRVQRISQKYTGEKKIRQDLIIQYLNKTLLQLPGDINFILKNLNFQIHKCQNVIGFMAIGIKRFRCSWF